jgi:flavin reductase (DIM6/NTAB) family NADH-FMN oxidoreductase RutF
MTPDTLDTKAANDALGGLRPFPVAVTSVEDGRANGLIALSAGSGSVIGEAPRVIIGLSKVNFTHDMVLRSGILVVHLLASDPLEPSLEIIRALGGSSGRDGDKLGGLRTKTGVTGAPVLLDALLHVEGRVVASMDCDENTYFMADVVAAERHSGGKKLDIGTAWRGLGEEWVTAYEHGHEAQVDDARRRRGLPVSP